MQTFSFKVARLFGIDIRIDLFFIAGVVLLLYLGTGEGGLGLHYSLLWISFLFLFVLLHEFGHCWAAIRNGGTAESITLWPLGGLARITGATNSPRETIEIAAMGPAVNFILCILIGVGLLLAGKTPDLHPFRFNSFVDGLFKLNLMLFLFNLIPGFPLDGGRILQGILAIRLGYGKSLLIATWVGQGCSVILGMVAIGTSSFMLAGIAIYMFIVAWQERQMLRSGMLYAEAETTYGHDFSGGYTTVEGAEPRRRPSWLRGLRERRRRRRDARSAREAAEMKRKVDELLEKVSRDGIDSLTAKERRFLEDASRKFRTTQKP